MDMEKKLYTLLVYSENIAGLLNQITAVFTRRQVNIESLNVSGSSTEGIHKYTITAWSDEEQIKIITRQIEKKIDIVKANYYTDDQLFIHEVALFKISTPRVSAFGNPTRIGDPLSFIKKEWKRSSSGMNGFKGLNKFSVSI